jgi:hypothetical protein
MLKTVALWACVASSAVAQTGTKVTDLTDLSTAAVGADLLYIVDDPLGTPLSKKVNITDLLGNLKVATLITVDADPAFTVEDGSNQDVFNIDSATPLVTIGGGVTTQVIANAAMVAATGNESAFTWNYTTNKATSGNDTGILLNMTDTLSPGTSYLMDLQVGGTSKFTVSNLGNVTAGVIYLPNSAGQLRSETRLYFFDYGGSFQGLGAGSFWIGHTASDAGGGISSLLQIHGDDENAGVGVISWNADNANGPVISVTRSRNNTKGSHTVVNDGDSLGRMSWYFDDGNDLVSEGARIEAVISGTPGANDGPTDIRFSVTADGAATPTLACKIRSDGRLMAGNATAYQLLNESASNTNPTICPTSGGNTGLGGSGDTYLSGIVNSTEIWRATATGFGTNGTTLGFFGTTPTTQAAHLIDATDLPTALTRINAILDILESYGLMAGP